MTPVTRWLIIVACLMIIWGSIFALLYLKADEVTKDPCGICAKKMGKNVVCQQISTENGLIPAVRVYYPNGSIYEPGVQIKEEPIQPLNITWPPR